MRRQTDGGERCAKRQGIGKIRRMYFDEGVSAKAGKNLEKEFAQLLKDLKPSEPIIVEDLDRISRMHPWLAKAEIYRILSSGHPIITWLGESDKVYSADNLDELDNIIVADIMSPVGSN
jgi:hypothetical protein